MKIKAHFTIPLVLALAACSAGPDGDTRTERPSPSERIARIAQRDSIGDQLLKYLPDGIKTIGGLASDAMSVYSGVKSALDVLTSLGRALGLLDTPVPLDQQIAALQSDVNALAGTLSWQMDQQDRQHRMAAVQATLDHLNMLRTQGMSVNTGSDGVLDSQKAVYDAETYGIENTAFLHLFKSSVYANPLWGYLGPPSGAPSDAVYDWRIGVPELMQLINIRLQIIATADPDFRHETAFNTEFIAHHLATLQSHFQKMVQGINCTIVNNSYNDPDGNFWNSFVAFQYICGDTASGAIIAGDTAVINGPCGDDCSQQLYLTQAVPGMEELRQRLLAAMPLAEMQQMMKMLWTYANPGSDEQPVAASTWGGNRLDAFYRDSAGGLRHKARDDGGTWLPTEDLGGSIVGTPSATSWGPDRIDVFVKGTDNAVYHQSGTSAGMSNVYESLSGQIRDTPHAVSWGPGRLDVFANGLGYQLFDTAWDAVSQPMWGTWWMLGGGNVGTPAPVASAPNLLDIFATGHDGSLQHVAWDGAQWHAPESLGGTLSTPPAVASWGPNRLDVFALGTDHALYHQGSSGGSFGGWEYIGGTFSSVPSVVSWGSGRLDIFVRGTDGALWHDSFDDSRGGWGSFESLGGWIAGGPVALAPAFNRLDVLVVDENQGLEHKSWDGQAWRDYEYIGDGFSVAP